MTNRCIICGASDFTGIFHQYKVPVCSNAPLYENEIGSELLSELDIVQCQFCSHVYNKAFDSEIIEKIYNENYSSGIPNSKVVIDRYDEIISSAITEDNIKDKVVVEIGASDFTFSELLLKRRAKNIIAFEPSNLFKTTNPNIAHIREYFSTSLLPKNRGKIDIIIMRHVLEHMSNPTLILKQIAGKLDIGSMLYVEVPNIGDIVNKKRFYDFFYEHVSYFSPELLKHILKMLGFEVVKYSQLINGQHFALLCRKIENKNKTKLFESKFASNKTLFNTQQFNKYTKNFLAELHIIFNKYERIAIYGAGSHSIYLASFLNLNGDIVKFLLDINRLKENKYSPATHIIIKSPSIKVLKELDAIVIIASLHQAEIHNDLRNKYKFKGKIFGTYPSITELL
jgi:hypothetical protein